VCTCSMAFAARKVSAYLSMPWACTCQHAPTRAAQGEFIRLLNRGKQARIPLFKLYCQAPMSCWCCRLVPTLACCYSQLRSLTISEESMAWMSLRVPRLGRLPKIMRASPWIAPLPPRHHRPARRQWTFQQPTIPLQLLRPSALPQLHPLVSLHPHLPPLYLLSPRVRGSSSAAAT